MVFLIVLLVIVAAIAFWGISIYNKLIALKNNYQNCFAQIEVQLKRRYDLIPNLVNIAKQYMAHEAGTLEAVINARNGASSALQKAKEVGDESSMQELAKAESNLNNQMAKLNISVEAYPDLKANTNMMQLSEEITTTENKVAYARQAYNDAVTDYNSTRQMFPNNIIANRFGHIKDASLLEFEDKKEIQSAPKVQF